MDETDPLSVSKPNGKFKIPFTKKWKTEFERPCQLMHACRDEILLAGLGSKPGYDTPGRFGSYTTAEFIFNKLDGKPFLAKVDFLKGNYKREDNEWVNSKVVGVAFKLDIGSHMKDYLIRQLLNRCCYSTTGCWKEITPEKDCNDPDRDWVLTSTPIFGYYDNAERVLTVWDSTQIIAYQEGRHF